MPPSFPAIESHEIWRANTSAISCEKKRNISIPLILILLLVYLTASADATKFLGPIKNVTVTVGRDASLSCYVANLGSHRVGWIHLKRQMIVAVHKRMITRISRYSVTHDSHATWTLHITGVKEEDGGYYMCQVNTEPALSQVGFLQVVVPPTIVDDQSSPSEIQVREKKNVTLRCAAEGSPEPRIRWRREDGQKIIAGHRSPVDVHEGEVLELEQVSRTHMGAYLCIASNGVPPSVSKRIILKVKFPPQIHVPNQLVGVPTGDNVTIECHVEAYPKAISYWVRDNIMMMNSPRYRSETTETVYQIHMRLTVMNFTSQDNKTYKCVAKNSLGETEGDIRLNEIYIPPKAKEIRSGESLNQEVVVKPTIVKEKVKVGPQRKAPIVENQSEDRPEGNIMPGKPFPLDQGFESGNPVAGKGSVGYPINFILLCIFLLLTTTLPRRPML